MELLYVLSTFSLFTSKVVHYITCTNCRCHLHLIIAGRDTLPFSENETVWPGNGLFYHAWNVTRDRKYHSILGIYPLLTHTCGNIPPIITVRLNIFKKANLFQLKPVFNSQFYLILHTFQNESLLLSRYVHTATAADANTRQWMYSCVLYYTKYWKLASILIHYKAIRKNFMHWANTYNSRHYLMTYINFFN